MPTGNVFNLTVELGHDIGFMLQLSLTACEPVMKEANGRQGSTYYLTVDKRFIIKTLTREEVEEMHHILKHYHEVSGFLCVVPC